MPASRTIHRTAVFTLPQPTHHARKTLERAFRDYAHAYGTLLYVAYLRYGREDDLPAGRMAGLDALRGLATYAIDEKTQTPRQNARTITQRLYSGEQLPPRAKEALARLPSRLRQSAREHAGQTLMSYLAVADLWLQTNPQQRGGAPAFPQRLRAEEVQQKQQVTLAALAHLADHRGHERQLVADLLTTREPGVPAIPFVGLADDYGCMLYYCADTQSYYARLDIGSPATSGATPLDMHGVYTQIKSGERWASASYLADLRAHGEDTSGIQSFAGGKGRLWLPLKLDEVEGKSGKRESYHQRALRFTEVTFLPKPGSGVAAAEPVSAKLVRKQARGKEGKVWYQLHVSFELPAPALDTALGVVNEIPDEQRPILAVHRGLRHLYAAALVTPDGRRELATFAASGDELLARQAKMERMRTKQQQRGKQPLTVGERRQSRIADHEIQVCANQIVEVARRERAQVVFEDLSSFASGAAVRATRFQPQHRTAAFRAFLNRRQFEALRQAVEQRLELVALPPVRMVPAAFVSQTCTHCGAKDTRTYEERRKAAISATLDFDPRLFSCPVCGIQRDVDASASVNTARKLVWLHSRGDEKRAGKGEGERTSWEKWVLNLCSTPATL